MTDSVQRLALLALVIAVLFALAWAAGQAGVQALAAVIPS